ncbi:MAG: DUF1838 family protein [Gammaproteobacteria bacterium]|nr:DUF1838 family protein [Gammaproteobacteria bacterium]
MIGPRPASPRDVKFTRRRFLGGAGGLAVMGAPFSSLAPPDAGSAISLPTPLDNLLALIRIQASLREEDVPWWYSGVIYGAEDGKAPRLLFGFEGMEMYWMRHLAAGEFELVGHTVSFLKDAESGEWLGEWRNPYTGETLEAPAAVQGGGAGRGFNYSEKGIRPTPFIEQMPEKPPAYRVLSGGGQVWLSKETEYPPGMAPPRLQRQTMSCPLDAFNNPAIERLSTQFASTVFMPWRAWMRMDGRPGHLIWHAAGLKLDSVESLPPSYRERLEAEHPDKLTARPG